MSVPFPGPPSGALYTADDFAHSPFVAFYEVTRACDLVCQHCRACAQPKRHPHELNTAQSKSLIEQFAAFPKPPVLVFTGGDPMKREDIFELVSHARDCGLTTAMTPSATPLVTRDAVRKLQDAGISRLALSLDGVNATTHDAFRGVAGSFARTMEILEWAHECGLPAQINTTVTRHNYERIPDFAALLETLNIVLWSVFFLIPVGRGQAEQRLSAEQCEEVFEALWQESKKRPYGIKTTEAHHYRRFVLQRAGNPQNQPGGAPKGRIQRAPIGVNDGRGVMFVSHTGSVFPSGFMPIRCGSFIEDSIVRIYQNSPMFCALRSPELLKGKCGACEFRSICGGSRARAYALTRDPLAAEPDCAYIPHLWSEKAQRSMTEVAHA
jgi:AdoMet-dependent heme synthase